MKSLHYSLEPQCGANLLIKDWQIKWLDKNLDQFFSYLQIWWLKLKVEKNILNWV